MFSVESSILVNDPRDTRAVPPPGSRRCVARGGCGAARTCDTHAAARCRSCETAAPPSRVRHVASGAVSAHPPVNKNDGSGES